MPSASDPPPLRGAAPTVFISYASQDREAARALREGLSAAGFDVWYDENELGGGDAWDQKIRRQIRDCSFFMPVISANANARHEGYFRREWRLAVERTLDMADDVTFLLPVVIDATTQASARVPEKFLTVQWHTVTGGQRTPTFDAWCARLLRGESEPSPAPRPRSAPAAVAPAASLPQMPEFPGHKQGQGLVFFIAVVGWALNSVWTWYRRLPRGRRRVVVLILVLLLFDKTCSHHEQKAEPTAEQRARAQQLIKDMGQRFDKESQASDGKADLTKLGVDIAAAVNHELGDKLDSEPDVFAVPFSAKADDPVASRFAGTVFASLYGRLSIDAPGKIALGRADSEQPLIEAKARNAGKLLSGSVSGTGQGAVLQVTVIAVDDGKTLWTHSFPVSGDPNAVVDEIRTHLSE